MGEADNNPSPLEARLEELLGQELFEPPADFVAAAQINSPDIYAEAEADPEAWWCERARELDWFKEFTVGLDASDAPFYKWFEDGELNASHNCLDRHVEAGLGDRVAYYWYGEEGEEREVTYAGLLAEVKKTANALKARGIKAGDVVGIYLPMIPEVVVAMLACARIGAPHNVVFGGFSTDSVRERMEFSHARALFVPDGARRKGKTAPVKADVDEAMGDLDDLETIFVVRHTGIETPMTEGRDVWLDEACAAVDAECPAEPLPAEHPLFILYSSGSTAKPKGILHTTGGYLTGVAFTQKEVFDLKPES
ncbi:MAG: AMP-binding protein, partial [Solirubrobacterales bacterium]